MNRSTDTTEMAGHARPTWLRHSRRLDRCRAV